MSNLPFRATLVLGLCLGTASALAEPDSQSVTVRFDDLNLATIAGEHALHSRVVDAVKLVCGDIDPSDLAGNALIQACRATAMKEATPRIESAIASTRKAKSSAVAAVSVPPPAL